ncbi:hypothetical protein B9Z19DRAFT_1078668 [Tuber borchii]|uniref:Uncharacterized protein n=1 Tax=Tuber borchii TaxID=42251 RepID=A0A2T6ZZ72_TUBBO|nr:hypothetical protein B9Z19DRAFT_1078668 [Tuber borchii]
MPCHASHCFFYYFIISSSIFDWLNAYFSILQPVPFFLSFFALLASLPPPLGYASVSKGAEYGMILVQTQTLPIPYENAMGSNDFHGETLTCLPPGSLAVPDIFIHSFHSYIVVREWRGAEWSSV